MEYLREHGIATSFLIPVIAASSVSFATTSDWTPAAGDVKVSADEGAFNNITTLPTASGNMWKLALSAAEMQGARIVVQIVDQGTKTVEDQAIVIATYGASTAQHAMNINDALRAGLTALPSAVAGANTGLPLGDANGRVDVGAWLGTTPLTLSANRIRTEMEQFGSAVAFSAGMRTDIRNEASAALTDYDALVPADLPTNFASLSISGTGIVQANVQTWDGTVPLSLSAGRVRTEVESYASWVDFTANQTSSIRTEVTDGLIAYDAVVPADLPTNFSSLTIETDGMVHADVYEWQGTSPLTMGTGSRIRVEVEAYGSALDFNATQTSSLRAEIDDGLIAYDALVPADLPTNFSAMGIEADGHVHGDVKEWLGVAPLSLSANRVRTEMEQFGSAVGFSAGMRTDIRNEASAALTDYDAIVPADLPTNFGSLSISAGGVVQSNVQTWDGTVPLSLSAGRVRAEVESYASWVDFTGAQTSSIRTEIDDSLTAYDAIVPADLPTNFSSMTIETDGMVHADVYEWQGTSPLTMGAGSRIRVETEAWGSGLDINAAMTSSIRTEIDDGLTAYDALVPADLPTNFSAMGIEVDGHVHSDVKEWLGVAPLSLSANRVRTEMEQFGSAVGFSAGMRTDIRNEASAALTDYDAVVPADLPTNFASLSISGAGVVQANVQTWDGTAPLSLSAGRVRVEVESYASWVDFTGNQRTSIRGEASAALADYDALVPADVPANFSSMVIDTDGLVNADVKEWQGTSVLAITSGSRPRVEVEAYGSPLDFNATQTSSIRTEIDDAIAAYDAIVPADLPTNFASLSISAGGVVHSNLQQWDGTTPLSLSAGRVRTEVESYASWVDFTANQTSSIRTEITDGLIAYDALVPADLPANFASLSISAGGVAHANIQSWGGASVLSTSGGRVRVDVESYGSVLDFNSTQKASINAEAVDVLATDTYAEPAQGAPGATVSLSDKIGFLYKSWRNKKDNDGSITQLYADDATTVDHKQTTSTSAGSVIKAEWVSGP